MFAHDFQLSDPNLVTSPHATAMICAIALSLVTWQFHATETLWSQTYKRMIAVQT